MPGSLFTITPTPPTVVKLAAGGRAEFRFTVDSLGAPERPQDVSVRAFLVTRDGRREEVDWLVAEPRQATPLSGGGTLNATIYATATAKAPVGENRIQLAVFDNDRPHDDVTYSSPVTCEIMAAAGKPAEDRPARLPGWIIPAIAASGALGIAGIAIALLRNVDPPPLPPPPEPPPPKPLKVCGTISDSFVGLTGSTASVVEESWRPIDCQQWVQQSNENPGSLRWRIGCLFPVTAGQPVFSWGQMVFIGQISPPPNPNCGW